MTGRDRIVKVLSGEPVDRPPVLPMMHTGLAGCLGVPLGRFFTNAATMARVMIDGGWRFGFDGVQLSSGVTAEAEALGAAVEQPADAAPILKEYLLADVDRLAGLRQHDVAGGGRIPLFLDAVTRVAQEIGEEVFVLATLRGPLVTASQLRGVEEALIDLIERPAVAEDVLTFGVDVTLAEAGPLLSTGAHGLLLGEATCSPNFISPAFYRRLVLPHHKRLVSGLKALGWRFVGLHICGDIRPIVPDIISAGVDFVDLDYQVPAGEAITLSRGEVALRGNLDPSSVLRFGNVELAKAATAALVREVHGARWIVGSGCDIPPGTPVENVEAMVRATRGVEN